MEKQISEIDVKAFEASFESDSKNLLAMNAVTRVDAREVAFNRDAYNKISHTYSHLIKTGTATAQGSTGRCWMFAGTNVLRIYAMKKLNMKDGDILLIGVKDWHSTDTIRTVGTLIRNILSTRGQNNACMIGVPHDMEFKVVSLEDFEQTRKDQAK